MSRRFFAASFLFLLSAALAAGEPKRAILEKGPFDITGIEVLAPNALPACRTFYTVDGARIEVLGSRGTIFYTGKQVFCQAGAVVELDTTEEAAYGLEADPGLNFFFIFPRGYADPCAFITGFVKRFEFFRNSSRSQKDIPFPAVFEL